MSYSRWQTSKFYSYWQKASVYGKEDEIFIVHIDLKTYQGFTYTECKVMTESKLKLKGRMNAIDDDIQAEELQGYMREFIADVDGHYLSQMRGGQ